MKGQSSEEETQGRHSKRWQAEEEWKEYLTISVKLEFILEAIAAEMGVELDMDVYEASLAEYVAYYNLESAEPVFETYGYGDLVYGERMVKSMHLQSDMLEKLMETAVVTVAEPVEESAESITE